MSESGTGAFKINEPSGPGSHLAIHILIAIVLALVAPHVAMQFEVGGEICLRPDVDPPSAVGRRRFVVQSQFVANVPVWHNAIRDALAHD